MKPLLFIAALIAVLLLSCSRGRQSEENKHDAVAVEPAYKAKEAPSKQLRSNDVGLVSSADADTVAMANTAPLPQSGTPVNNPDWDKKIIKTANITLELKDYAAYNNNMHTKLRGYGAYIAQETQNQTYDQITNDIVIKVPVERFDDVVNSLNGEGIKIVQKNITSEDVTGEVVDTKARLEAKKQVRDRYLDLLKQAKSMKDILDVQEQINGIQEDIESATGRVDYLVHSAAYSTINVKYYQFLNGVTAKDIEPTFIAKIGNAFKTGGEIITNIVLFFVSIWPLSIAGVVLVIYFKKMSRKKKVVVEG